MKASALVAIELPSAPTSPAGLLLGCLLVTILCATTTHAALTTNNWSTGNGKWEIGANWSAGTPSPSNTLDQIVNSNPMGGGVVTIDVVTVNSNTLNSCLTISNLTVGGTFASPHILFLNNASNTPGTLGLDVENSLTISSHGVVSITNSYLYAGELGVGSSGIFDDGLLILNTGTLITGAGPVTVGNNGIGQMTVSSGTWKAGGVVVGNAAGSGGTLTLAGGSTIITQSLTIANQSGATGSVWMTGGQLVTTNNTFSDIGIGGAGFWQMTVSNGTWLGRGVLVGPQHAGQGALTLAGGTYTFSGDFVVGGVGSTNTVWLTGGQLTASPVVFGSGSITMSNGVWYVFGGVVEGTITLAGGQMLATNSTIEIGDYSTVGHFNLLGGSFSADRVDLGVGNLSAGYMTALHGSAVIRSLNLGQYLVLDPYTGSGEGELTMAGGSMSVLSNVTVGDCLSGGSGFVRMTGGALFVTNATHDAVLNVSDGFFLLDGGALVVDTLRVDKDTCVGFFDHTGGTLSYRALVLEPSGDADGDGLPTWWEQLYGLDPLSSSDNNGPEGDPDGDGYSNLEEYLAGSDPQNPLSTPLQITAPPFQITSIVQSNNNIVLTWNTAGGSTNQVQVTSGGSGGSYSTNGFTNLGSPMVIGGTGIVTTNYTDTGGATNFPARYYRVRLVP